MTSPFRIQVPDAVLDDLRDRLARTRWPDHIEGADWDYGTDPAYLQGLVDYWRDEFDWRAQEAMLNGFPQFKTEVDGHGMHYIHQPGTGPAPMPLLLTHGWPDSFYRFYKLIPLLTDPGAHGGDPADAFSVVAPSIPGFGFSDRPTKKGMTPVRVAKLFAELMEGLGYERYGAHGGDWGSTITEALVRLHPKRLDGIHLTDIPFTHIFTLPEDDLSREERAFVKKGKAWQMQEGAYAMIQGSKPQTLGYGLNDSPAGLAAWIVEKFRTWSDVDGDPANGYTRDELLTNIMIYWVTETINSANRLYYENAHQLPFGRGKGHGRVEVPTGVAVFPKDIVPGPRAFGERVFNIQRWTEMPRGGHFAALEEPELLAEDLRAFFRPLREQQADD